MFRLKVIAILALIALFVGSIALGDAAAGEKHRTRAVKHLTKWQPVEIPGEEGRVLASFEQKGIDTNLGGKSLFDGWLYHVVGLWEVNEKAHVGSGYGYILSTDPDGDKVYMQWEGKRAQGDLHSRGTGTIVKGMGKWEGIQGKCTWVTTNPAPGQEYVDVDWDIELPRR